MLKNAIIISSLLLLLSSLSLIKPIDAKPQGKRTNLQVYPVSSGNTADRKISPRLNELLAIGALRKFYRAEMIYRETIGKGRFGTPQQLAEADLIDQRLASLTDFGYRFSVKILGPTRSSPASFKFFAEPRIYGKTGKRSFSYDHRCRLRGRDRAGQPVTPKDPLIDICPDAFDSLQRHEMNVIAALRRLIEAENTYRTNAGGGNYGTLSDLYNAGLIDEVLATGLYSYYYFAISIRHGTDNSPAVYQIRAYPTEYGETGFRSFYADQTGVLRGGDHQGTLADKNDPPIKK